MRFFKKLYIGMLITNAAMYVVFIASMFYYIHSHDNKLCDIYGISIYSGLGAYGYGFIKISGYYLCCPGALMTIIATVSYMIHNTLEHRNGLSVKKSDSE